MTVSQPPRLLSLTANSSSVAAVLVRGSVRLNHRRVDLCCCRGWHCLLGMVRELITGTVHLALHDQSACATFGSELLVLWMRCVISDSYTRMCQSLISSGDNPFFLRGLHSHTLSCIWEVLWEDLSYCFLITFRETFIFLCTWWSSSSSPFTKSNDLAESSTSDGQDTQRQSQLVPSSSWPSCSSWTHAPQTVMLSARLVASSPTRTVS